MTLLILNYSYFHIITLLHFHFKSIRFHILTLFNHLVIKLVFIDIYLIFITILFYSKYIYMSLILYFFKINAFLKNFTALKKSYQKN